MGDATIGRGAGQHAGESTGQDGGQGTGQDGGQGTGQDGGQDTGRGTTGPQVRAGLAQESLQRVGALPEAIAHAVRARLPEAAIARIEAAAPHEWLPLESDVVLLEALRAEVGADGLRRLWRASLREGFERPPLGPVLHVATKRFGRTPEGLLRFLPEGFQAVFKGAGRLDVAQVSSGRAEVAVTGAPEEVLASEALLEALAATIEAGMDFGGATEAHVERERAVDGARFTLSWR